MVDIMVDLETTGTQPEHTNIIQISAVKFDLRAGTVDPNVFDMCLYPTSTRFWDEDTRQWWSTKPELLDKIYSRMVPARFVLEKFAAWVGFIETPTLWAKPSSFELPFLQSYYKEHELQCPFHFRNVMDQNTFIKARHYPDAPPAYEKDIEFEGEAHYALDDVFHQLKVVSACYEATRK